VEFFASLGAIVEGIPAHFIRNVDEMVHQRPVTVEQDPVDTPVSRIGKRITLIFCIAEEGPSIQPMELTDGKIRVYNRSKGHIVSPVFGRLV
jgi:hypothetical protein